MIDNIIKYKHHYHSSVVGVFVCLVAKYLEHAVHVNVHVHDLFNVVSIM